MSVALPWIQDDGGVGSWRRFADGTDDAVATVYDMDADGWRWCVWEPTAVVPNPLVRAARLETPISSGFSDTEANAKRVADHMLETYGWTLVDGVTEPMVDDVVGPTMVLGDLDVLRARWRRT